MKITSFLVQLRRGLFGGLLVLALTACGGGSNSSDAVVAGGDVVGGGGAGITDPAAPITTLSGAALDAEIKDLLALSPDERDRQARVLNAKVERDWLTLSGVEAELGGPAATDAAYAAMTGYFAASLPPANTPQLNLTPQAQRLQVRQVQQVTPFEDSAGGAMFMGSMEIYLLSEHFLEQSKDAQAGAPPTQDGLSSDGFKQTILTSLEKLTYDAAYDPKEFSSGLLASMNTHFDVMACPNADGVFTLNAKVETSMTKSGGVSGQKSTLDVAVTGHVNDDAQLIYADTDMRMEMADFTNRKGAYVDFAMKYAIGNSPRPSSGTVNRTGGQMTDAFATDAYKMGKIMSLIIASQMLGNAEKAWQSGRCVTLQPTTDPAKRTGLPPSQSVAITAAPRSKLDGGPVGGSVTASLSGAGAVAPGGTKVPADASFTYTAAGTADQAGTVSLEARSKRGVAKADLNFDTAQDSWIGTASFSDGIMSSTAQITWLFMSSENNVSMYKETGAGTVASNDGTCSYPATSTLADGAGILFVDFNSTPPTYHGAGTTGIVTVTVTCKTSTGVETHVQPVALPVFGGTKGPQGVEAAGAAVTSPDAPMKIEGSDTDGLGGSFHWSFARNR